ncbi:hypothetical protein K2173_025941 [Erythroxylum novogranatense]|uniref:Protein kinase domain-containing protein n=1 Tax=Erythroxylum novogranatense TaxID=1862640 RepID=A0AAV8SIB4_9ROSI|nr:hypothetical protein K2173_025941 [Erythroxylum novogranatense]
MPPPITALYFFSLLYHFTLLASANLPFPYVPRDNITLDCGSNSDNIIAGRTWAAETRSELLLVEQNNASVTATAAQQPTSENRVPYGTARLSTFPFTYSFPVTAGPKFVRLYFYPASYLHFKSSNSFFTVKADKFTLLSNFSARLHARAEDSEVFYREFCLYVDDHQRLNITFIPSPDMPDSFAFINGIEVVSMPDNLYYNNFTNDQGIRYVGNSKLPAIDSSFALELMYRLNVGGKRIYPQYDTSLYRNWFTDDNYLTDGRPSSTPSDYTIQLTYDNFPRYSAPDQVYQSARTMGDTKMNLKYNLTWEFRVDSGFSYFLRLHFCEFQPPILQPNDRVFEIFIADQAAEPHADVIYWSGGNGVPVKQDYLVLIGAKGGEKVQNLSVKLHPKGPRDTSYSDVILNGLEIFKLSSLHNLGAPNPDLPLMSPPIDARSTSDQSKSKSNRIRLAAIIAGSASGIAVLCLLALLVFGRRLRVKDSRYSYKASKFGPFSFTSTKSGKTQKSALPTDLCHHFSLAEIKAATNNFDKVFIIGIGGFGNVYKGFIDGGATPVAIKKLNPESRQGANEFKTEIEMLSQLRHLHLVSLIGYCYEEGEMILVYDYMAHGTLRDHLYKTNNPPLPWKQRLEICIGAARGLQYLHSGANHTIIHRDVKTTNILLDEKWVAKVSDFGLSKMGPTNMTKTHISTVVKGSFGYVDPEYYRLQQLTEKSDVYSFGVVLCEVLCAEPPVNKTISQKPESLAESFRQCHRKRMLSEIIDPHLDCKITPNCLKKFSEITASCLLDKGVERPSMGDVVWGLEFALGLQQSTTGDSVEFGRFETQVESINEKSPLKDHSVGDDSDDLFSTTNGFVINSRVGGMTTTSSSDGQCFGSNKSDALMSAAVFSEIMNAKGR